MALTSLINLNTALSTTGATTVPLPATGICPTGYKLVVGTRTCQKVTLTAPTAPTVAPKPPAAPTLPLAPKPPLISAVVIKPTLPIPSLITAKPPTVAPPVTMIKPTMILPSLLPKNCPAGQTWQATPAPGKCITKPILLTPPGPPSPVGGKCPTGYTYWRGCAGTSEARCDSTPLATLQAKCAGAGLPVPPQPINIGPTTPPTSSDAIPSAPPAAEPTPQSQAFPPGSIARWHVQQKVWWVYLPKTATFGGLGELGEDPPPADAVVPGDEKTPPPGTSKGPSIGAPFYKTLWFWGAVAGVLAVGGGTFYFVRRRRAV